TVRHGSNKRQESATNVFWSDSGSMTVLRRLLTRLLSPRVFTGGICGSAQQENRGFPSIQDLQELVKRLVHQQKSLTSAAASRDGETTDPRRPLVLPSKEAMKLCEKMRATRLIESLVSSENPDETSVILEVMSGRTTGGDICQQFTAKLLEMYQRFASYKSWHWEVLKHTPTECGGLHYASVRVTGDSVFRALCFEAGTHRVQVIPDSGLSSRMQRIHTGTATVIVLPDTQEMMVHVSAKDLRIDTFRSGGAGGQHVNSTDSAVRVTHLPTGTVCECQQYRSQLKNRQTALSELRSRLEQSMVGKQQELLVHSRVTQVGTRHQAERIRTYNFTQGRVTDHRIGFETRNIKEFMRGASLLEELHQLLQEKDQREKLMELMEISGQNMKSS
ncbi:hypothetical protein DNTS_003502, partial [Danionella cerebrum]